MLLVVKTLGESNERSIRCGTLGVYPILIPPLFFFSFLALVSIYIKHSVGMFVFGGVFSVPLLLGSIAKIKVVGDGIIVKRIIFGTSYWSFDEVKFKMGGRILAYGGMYGGWIMPLNWRECVDAIQIHKIEAPIVRKAPSKIHPYIYLLVPPITLWVIENLLHHFELTIPALFNAPLWGVTATFSLTAFVDTAPIKFKIDNLSRFTSSIIVGLLSGLTVTLLLILL